MIPTRLEISNFFSHKDSEIDFTKFNSALLIGNTDGDYTKSNGSGKCLSGNTILTEAYTGEEISVKDLHENFKEFYVWGLNKDLTLSPTRVVATQQSGIKSMLKVTMASGAFECVSETHPIVIQDMSYGLVCRRASELSCDNLVAASVYLRSPPEHEIARKVDFTGESHTVSKSDIFLDEVSAIEKIPDEQTYDIQVDNDTKLYALSGFITHNSVIFDSILWGLFNKSRAMMMDDIIRWGETSCCVLIEFKHDDKFYRVKRGRNRVSSTSTIELSYLDQAGDWIDISCSTSGDTNKKIEEIIRLDHKTFVNSIYFRQNDISEFAEVEASKKKEILKSIVDISRWDEYEKEARKNVKDISLECKILKKSVESYDEVSSSLNDVRIQIAESRLRAEDLLLKKDACLKDISSLEVKYSNLKKSLDTDTFDKATGEALSLKKEESTISVKIKAHEDRLSGLNADIKPINHKISELKTFLDSNLLKEVSEVKVTDLKKELSAYMVDKSSSEELLKHLSEIEISNDHCYVCKQTIVPELYSTLKEDVEARSEEYLTKIESAKLEILKTSKELKILDDISAKNEKIKKANENLESEIHKSSFLQDSIDEHTLALSTLSISIENITASIKRNNDILKSIKNEDFQSLRDHLKLLRDSREQLLLDISKEDINIGRLLERESNILVLFNKIKEDKKIVSEKLKRIALFEKLGKMFGKNGIQTILLDAIIEDLEKTSNVILSSICNEPISIVLETQRLGSDGVSTIETLDLKVQKDGYLQNFKSLSGGEKFRISLALRIGLSDMSSRYGGSSLEFLLMDEVNSPLDRYGVETLFVNVIKALEDKYKILVITHDESLKEKFDNVLDVTKVGGDSTIRFTTR